MRASMPPCATPSTSSPPGGSRGVPIMVGGNGPNVTWRLAARFADELNVDGMSPDDLREALPVIRSRCEEIDRDPDSLSVSLHAWWGEPAWTAARRPAGGVPAGARASLASAASSACCRRAPTSDERAGSAGPGRAGGRPAPWPASHAAGARGCRVSPVAALAGGGSRHDQAPPWRGAAAFGPPYPMAGTPGPPIRPIGPTTPTVAILASQRARPAMRRPPARHGLHGAGRLAGWTASLLVWWLSDNLRGCRLASRRTASRSCRRSRGRPDERHRPVR